MDSSARLDYALFQLTPTRTRCELVIFTKNSSEKLASGLVDPFISHLRCAKEQIPKGGYSITLRPPTSNASWFTKGALERFVRFVSTPEVLERFVTIEKEISQIEISISISNQSSDSTLHTDEGSVATANAKTAIVPYKPKGESNEKNEAQQGDNSKLRLQKVLETRKVVLRKEQAMAYARAFVAGFDIHCLDDLISFSDAFGASRLREACINFKELCHKKHNDGLWMDELAAVQAFAQPELPYLATSGIVLAGDGGLSNGQFDPNASISDSTPSPANSDSNQGNVPPTNAQAQGSMPWPNHLPPFMYNFQQMPPYQGYPFPGMQGVSPYYPGNMQWPPNGEESGRDSREVDNRRNRKSSSRKKEKLRKEKESETSEGEDTDASDSPSSSEVENDKKHSSTDQHRKKRNGKKSSRTVVIRNINYITSNKKDGEETGLSNESSSDEDDFIDGTSLKQKVEDAVGSLEKHHKSRRSKKRGGNKNHTVINGEADHDLEDDLVSVNGKTNNNWDTFQNILMRDDKNDVEKHQALDVRDEYFAIKGSDSMEPAFINSHSMDPESENRTKQRMVATDSLIMTERDEGNNRSNHLENFERNGGFRPSMIKRDSGNEELLFSHRTDNSQRIMHDSFVDSNNEYSRLKTQKGEDWFIANQSDKTMGRDSTKDSSIFDADQGLTIEKHNKDSFVDYSIMVQSRTFEDQPDSQWKTDISMISDLTGHSQIETNIPDVSEDKQGVSGKYEADDLCMMLERDVRVEPTGPSWTPEIDYAIDLSFTEADKRQSIVETSEVDDNKLPSNGKNTKKKETKPSSKDIKSKPRTPLWQSKHEIISRPKKPFTASRAGIQKSKTEKEEETRKRMEEIVIERQKRIAERSAARGLTAAAPKASPPEKQPPKSTTQEAKRLSLPKPGISSSTIDRLASPQIKNKGLSTPTPKSTPPKKPSSKMSLSPKVSDDENKNVSSSENKVVDRSPSLPSESTSISTDQKELHDRSSMIMKNNQEKIHDDPSLLVGKSSPPEKLHYIKMQNENGQISKVTSTLNEEKTIDHDSHMNGFSSIKVEDHLPTEPEKSLNSTAENFQVVTDATVQALPLTSEISEEVLESDQVESVSPTTNEVIPDPTHTRKKWSSNESSTPVAKGLKKLLMFGRKTNISATS